MNDMTAAVMERNDSFGLYLVREPVANIVYPSNHTPLKIANGIIKFIVQHENSNIIILAEENKLELNIKNARLIPLFEEHRKADEAMQEAIRTGCPENTPLESLQWLKNHPEDTMISFFDELMYNGANENLPLDLTYDTLNNLTKSLGVLFKFQKKMGYRENKNISLMGKTLASYLTLLAINEHNFWFRTKEFSGRYSNVPLWADIYQIMTGKMMNVDFLPCCMAAVQPQGVTLTSGLTIHVDSIVPVYEELTGVDLRKYGFSNFFMYVG